MINPILPLYQYIQYKKLISNKEQLKKMAQFGWLSGLLNRWTGRSPQTQVKPNVQLPRRLLTNLDRSQLALIDQVRERGENPSYLALRLAQSLQLPNSYGPFAVMHDYHYTRGDLNKALEQYQWYLEGYRKHHGRNPPEVQ
ncbi:MAG: hypothetical protein ACPL1K_03685 [Candidatus Kryptoniota bacterium]